MQQKVCLSVKRITQISLLSVVLISCVMSSSSSDAKNSKIWNESKGHSEIKHLTPNTFVEIGERVNAAVINISTVENVKPMAKRQPMPFGGPQSPFDDLFKDFFDRFAPQQGMKRRSLGSGFIIHESGLIVTNNHVVARADEIKVVLSDDESFQASVVGRDPKTDIALIKIDPGKYKLKTVPLGESGKMRVGDMVVAIGNPFGLDNTLTTGVISAKGRAINLGNYDDFIQTDASINPGNSGGPLLNLHGEVIGINTAINAAGQGIGFAIPIDMAKNILAQLHTKGKVTRGWLGVYITRMDEDLAKVLNLKKPKGAVVTEVQEDSPAAKAKLKQGDIIITFNGVKIDDYNDLPKTVANTPPNTKVTVEILRDKKKVKLSLELGELPEEEMAKAKDKDVTNELGIEVQELTPELGRSLGIESGSKGVVATSVAPSSEAADKGLRRGDLIQKINGRRITNKKDYDAAVKKIKKGDSVLIWYKRRSQSGYIAFTVK